MSMKTKAKRSGAYSGGSYDTNAFMLLNWQDNLDNLLPLSIGRVTVCTQAILVKPNLMFTEIILSSWLKIASTTNENILTEKLLEEVEDDATRFAILNNFLDGFRGTVFRQTQFR